MIRPFRLVWLALCLFLLATGLVSVAQSPAYPLPIGSPVQVSGSLLELASQRLLVANPDSDTVSIVQPSGGTIDSEIAVGTEPRSVALAPDGVQAVIVNRGDGTLSVVDLLEGTLTATYSVGELPYAALVYGSSIVVTIQSEPSVILLDLKTGERQAEIRVPADPAAMAIWGRYLYVTHYWSGELTLIDLDAAEVLATLSLGPDIAHSASIAIDRRNGLAYLPQTIPNWQMTAAAPEARMLPVINVVDLSEMRLLPERQIFLPAADRMVNMPSAALIDRGRNSLYVTQAGSAALSIIDLDTGYVVAHVETGIAPMDVILSRNALSIYVHDRIDQTITEFDAVYRSYVDTMHSSAYLPDPLEQIGAQLFYDADDPRLSSQGSIACANCHLDGLSDGRIWEGTVTPVLRGSVPNTDINWLNEHIRQMQAGTGIEPAGVDAAALVAYLQALADEPAP
ncbi:MAG: hypothetical protein KC615_19885 [Anaerolineae bacterium]|nr:hypothetical protein [Anaerolineae bacterium]